MCRANDLELLIPIKNYTLLYFALYNHFLFLWPTGLPDVPNVVAVSDYGKGLAVEWSAPSPGTSAGGHVTYVVQERHHVGATYVPERMTTWAMVTRTDRTREQFRQLHAPGRWFQFRVAAINENGTSGYSPPSKQFFVEIGPRKFNDSNVPHITHIITVMSCSVELKSFFFLIYLGYL